MAMLYHRRMTLEEAAKRYMPRAEPVTDFSTKEGKAALCSEVDRRIGLGMEREKAEMLTAAMMWEPQAKKVSEHDPD